MTYHGMGGATFVLPGAQVYSAVVAAAAAGGGFAPTDISGCVLWLDASDVSTLFQDTAGSTAVTADGQTIGRWSDKSGNANHATQATSGSRPTHKTGIKNSLSIARFATTVFLELPTALIDNLAGASVLAVVNYQSTSGQQNVLYADRTGLGVGGPVVLRINSGVYQANGRRRTGEVFSTAGASTGATGWVSHSAVYSYTGRTIRQYIDGALDGENTLAFDAGALNSSFTDSGRSFRIGVSVADYLTGDIAEIIIYNSALGTADRESVESYLATKWGL